MNSKKIIYDIGSNNGDDIPYYLLKSDLVVAVEANPRLCDLIKNRFKEEIKNGSLVVENCVVQINDQVDKVPFYIAKNNHVLSQYPKPSNINDYEEIYLPSKDIIKIIKDYGDPFYIKIDVEHYDQEILKKLLTSKIIPPYISSESHNIKVFSSLVILGKYNSFKLVDGASVSMRYKDHEISTNSGKIKYSFPRHSAGPFGNDISGPWMTADNFFHALGIAGLGWKDIHASNIETPDANYRPQPHVDISIKI